MCFSLVFTFKPQNFGRSLKN
uniref:Uncharacterized protein n=1 Tax=Rhizophora mucronata TaxID=61149 RepID=A0A2P2Q1G4_RHIMU